MFRRKLAALDAPNKDTFVPGDDGQFQAMIVWLEDQKVRFYRIEDREGLRSEDGKTFSTALTKYLAELNCPYKPEDRMQLIDWLLGLAVRLSYEDNKDKYRNCRASTHAQDRSSSALSSGSSNTANPLEQMDMDDPAVKAGVISIATMLNIPPHSDHKEVLKAICVLIKEKFPRTAAAEAEVKSTSDASKDRTTLEEIPLGFSTGDYVTDEALKILRLLHINNLRELQTKINEALVSVQKITADPKTDQRLGKIGR